MGAVVGMICGQPAATSGAVQGQVVGNDGKSVTGAIVTLHKAGSLLALASAKSGTDGTFRMTGIAPGSYGACLRAGSGFINPCYWNLELPFLVMAGKITTAPPIIASRGSLLHVRLNDPGSVLVKTGLPNRVGVWVLSPSRLLYPLSVSSTDTSGRDLTLTIPFDTPLHLLVSGTQVFVKDQNGGQVNTAGSLIPFQHSYGAATQPSFSYSVTAQSGKN